MKLYLKLKKKKKNITSHKTHYTRINFSNKIRIDKNRVGIPFVSDVKYEYFYN